MDDVLKAALFQACRALGWQERNIVFRDFLDVDHPRAYMCIIKEVDMRDRDRIILDHIRKNKDRMRAPPSRQIQLRVGKPKVIQKSTTRYTFPRELLLRVLLANDQNISCDGCEDVAITKILKENLSESDQRLFWDAVQASKEESIEIKTTCVELRCCIQYRFIY
jgi:hypothetical protein